MGALQELPNIGKVLEDHLNRIGVETPEQLRLLGSRKAFLQIRAQVDDGACLHELLALEGAVQQAKKAELAEPVKQELKKFYKSV